MVELPNGPIGMIVASGLLGWLIILISLPCFIMTVVGLFAAKSPKWGIIMLGLCLTIPALGGFATCGGFMAAFHDIATTEKPSIQQLAAGLYVSLTPCFIAFLLGAPLIVLNVIAIGLKWQRTSLNETSSNGNMETKTEQYGVEQV